MGAGGSTPVEMGFYKRLAYQIVHVVKDSPADQAGLRPYYDFVTHLPLIQTFTNSFLPYDEYVRDSMGKHPVIELTVFNCATGRVRRVMLTQGRYRRDRLDLTGFIVRPVIISDAIMEVEHVQEVQVGTPAHDAGLVPNLDYIIATDEGNCFDLHHIQRTHNPSDYVQLYVFDIFVQTSRVVQLPANCKSRFGCTLASGYLHRVPHTQKLTFYLRKTNNNTNEVKKLQTQCQDDSHNHDHQVPVNSKQQQQDIHCPLFTSEVKNSRTESMKNESVQTDDDLTHNYSVKNGILKEDQLQEAQSSPSQTNNHIFDGTTTCSTMTTTTTTTSNAAKNDDDDDECCTFVTRIKLKQVIEDADESAVLPVSVNLPKDILRNVISEMVRYEQDEILHRSAKQ